MTGLPDRIPNTAFPAQPVIELLCHFAFWFGLLFATPVFVAAHNPDDLVFTVPSFAAWTALACLLASLASWKLAALPGDKVRWWTARLMLTAAFIMAIQGNLVHGLFDYGAFNGERVDYSAYGWKYWLELLAWLAAFPLGIYLLSRIRKLPAWLPLIPVLSFVLLVVPAWLADAEAPRDTVEEDTVDPAVFEFSSVGNLVHLLPDGFQGDVVRQVFEEKPQLAGKFNGFTLFTNHVSTNQGTAPALYTMLTGRDFDFAEGFSHKDTPPEVRRDSYQRELQDSGYRVDYVPVSGFICLKDARSCIARPFNDMKARGIYRHRGEDIQYSVRLIADLSLFRLVPMYLKEKIHNDGRWFFADTTMDGSSPWPDPVIREWTENLHVTGEAPVYKWHHYVGTHIPAKWGAACGLLDEPVTDRGAYLEQAECILTGIGKLLDKLREAGIYDQTAMIISGDHGHNVASDDAIGIPLNRHLSPGLHGQGRPALLVKRRNNREHLAFSAAPTSVMDIHPTALKLVGMDSSGPSVFEITADEERERVFRVYSNAIFYTGNPVPYIEYRVGPDARNADQWEMTGIVNYREPPSAYDPVNRPNGEDFIYGAALRKSMGNNKSSWIPGRQLAFLIGLPNTDADRFLELSLQIPEWVGEQSFEVRFNDGEKWRSPILSFRDEEWQTVHVPFPVRMQQAGSNFVSVLFDRLGSPENQEDWQASAKIRTIRTILANENLQPVETQK